MHSKGIDNIKVFYEPVFLTFEKKRSFWVNAIDIKKRSIFKVVFLTFDSNNVIVNSFSMDLSGVSNSNKIDLLSSYAGAYSKVIYWYY